MARPRSDDKRNAILAAAAHVIGEEGTGAPTARIARAAGVAEGTLFTYFSSKDVLLNELYVSLKAEMRAAMMDGFPKTGTAERRVRHAWNGFLAWGIAKPDGHKALRQLGVCGRIDPQHRATGSEGFADLRNLLREKAAGSPLPSADAIAFISALFNSMAEASMEFIARNPKRADHYRDAGFRALWGALNAGSR